MIRLPATERAKPYVLGALAMIAVACGGKSIRHEGGNDETGGGGDEPPTGRGGSSAGTSPGGTTGAGPSGGGTTTAGTAGTINVGGTSSGGDGSVGGTSSVGGGSVGGTPSFGGTGIGGSAGDVQCPSGARPGYRPPEANLYWKENGRIDEGTGNGGINPFGIRGSWYSFDDCSTAAPYGLPCTKRDPTLVAYNGELGWAAEIMRTCARGVAAEVGLGPDGAPAWSIQWGFGIGLSLNDGRPWNAKSYCVDGFSFSVEGASPFEIRANLTTTTTESNPYFVTVNVEPFAATGRFHFFYFSDFHQGPWVSNPEPLDVTRLTNLQFFVYTNADYATPFDLCISMIGPIQSITAQ